MKYEQWKKFLAESAANPISYSDVRQEYDAILAFLKQDILQIVVHTLCCKENQPLRAGQDIKSHDWVGSS